MRISAKPSSRPHALMVTASAVRSMAVLSCTVVCLIEVRKLPSRRISILLNGTLYGRHTAKTQSVILILLPVRLEWRNLAKDWSYPETFSTDPGQASTCCATQADDLG